MDLVYIVKEGDDNIDLRYSLRSVAKFVKYDKLWIVGYKPKWVQNVEYIHVEQDKNEKWKNSVRNILTACQSKEISDNFILMNDDFFAIKPVEDLSSSVNVCLGKLDHSIQKHAVLNSKWGRAFSELKTLLYSVKAKTPFYDYEAHIPLEINKEKYLEVMNLPAVQKYMNSKKVLHKRSLYKNYVEFTNPRMLEHDVKINYDSEVPKKIEICDWLSVFDNQTGNKAFRRLNYLLQSLFPEKCQYEADDYNPIKVEPIIDNPNKKRVIIMPDGTRKIV